MASRTMKEKGKRQEYNAQGSEAMKAADDETPDFKRGGKAKKKHHHAHGGHVDGEHAKHRAHKPRGHHMEHEKHGGHAHKHEEHHKRKAGGRTPYSSGHKTSMPAEAGKTDSGHEGQRPEGG